MTRRKGGVRDDRRRKTSLKERDHKRPTVIRVHVQRLSRPPFLLLISVLPQRNNGFLFARTKAASSLCDLSLM